MLKKNPIVVQMNTLKQWKVHFITLVPPPLGWTSISPNSMLNCYINFSASFLDYQSYETRFDWFGITQCDIAKFLINNLTELNKRQSKQRRFSRKIIHYLGFEQIHIVISGNNRSMINLKFIRYDALHLLVDFTSKILTIHKFQKNHLFLSFFIFSLLLYVSISTKIYI